MRLAYDYLLVIALCLLMVSDAFGKDEDLETVSLDWIVYKNKLLNVAKRSGPSSTTEEAWTGRWMPERTTSVKTYFMFMVAGFLVVLLYLLSR